MVGGFSSTILFAAFAYTSAFRLVLYVLVVIVGVLVGLEIPLLMRILKDRFNFKDVVAHVLTFDYLGALGASLLFPLVLVPHLGLVRSALLFGLINAGVALWTTHLLKSTLRARGFLQASAVGVIVALGAGWIWSDRILEIGETNLYADDVVLAKTTPYQRIVLTAWKDDLRLFLNSHLQFSSKDEYRYHEALVHPGLSAQPNARRVLVLGGGDGLAVREILKHPGLETITLVDLDPAMTHLFSTHPELRRLNHDAFLDPRVHVVNADAFVWLEAPPAELYDFAVVDFPDPSTYSIGKLYTTAFYAALRRHLVPEGRFVVQSTSPLFARKSFWCVVQTVEATGLTAAPYHVYVPAFGEWGFVIGGRSRFCAANDAARRSEIPDDRRAAGALHLPPGHGARARRAESPEHADAREVLRAGVGWHQQIGSGFRVPGFRVPGFQNRWPTISPRNSGTSNLGTPEPRNLESHPCLQQLRNRIQVVLAKPFRPAARGRRACWPCRRG